MIRSVVGVGGRVAIVAGGGGNIGRATAIMLAQAGAHVVAVDIDGDQAEKTAVEASARGAAAVGLHADARRPDDIDSMVDAALKQWHRLDVGVNVVGGGPNGPSILEMSDEAGEDSVKTNLYKPG